MIEIRRAGRQPRRAGDDLAGPDAASRCGSRPRVFRPAIMACISTQVGRCEGPAFASAGPHWNPTGRQHGTLNPAGHHLGDLPNLDVDATGRRPARIHHPRRAPSGGAGGLFDADGAALVIHAAPDDYRTDPSGNSGARIACGVLGRERPRSARRRRGRARPCSPRASAMRREPSHKASRVKGGTT